MIYFKFDLDKALASSLYIIAKVEGNADFHKVFKHLYKADCFHLAKYGRPITGTNYFAMNYGPVPSQIYNIAKTVRGDDTLLEKGHNYGEYFSVINRMEFVPTSKPDMDQLSDSDVECLDKALESLRGMNFTERTDYTHDEAYIEAKSKGGEYDFISMAKSEGADDEMIKYITSNSEAESTFL